MTKKFRRFDGAMPNQLDLFDLEAFRAEEAAHGGEPDPGSLNVSLRVKEGLTSAMKSTVFKRYEIAGRMSEYIGTEITDSMLNSWTAESKEGHRFPLEYLPAFCLASGNFEVLDMIARACGCKLIRSEETALLELARLEQTKRQLVRKEKSIRQYIDQMHPKANAALFTAGKKE